MGLPHEEYGSTPKQYAWVYPPPKNSIFLYLTPKEILNFYNLPLRNSIGPQLGDTDINAIAISLKGNLDCKRPHLNTKIFRIQGLCSD